MNMGQHTKKPDDMPLRSRLFAAMAPVERLHLGHFAGPLQSWTRLQMEHDCFFMAADWAALARRYEDSSAIAETTRLTVADWISAGLDPDQCTIFVQSRVREHAELALILGMFTPVAWLTRVPEYKELALNANDKTLDSLGFLGLPALEAADALLYRANAIPAGDGQAARVELCRELARRVNFLYGPVFPEPKTIPIQTPRLLGIDGRELSGGRENGIYLSDSPRRVEMKIRDMVTDPGRQRRSDPGHPEVCSVFDYQKTFNETESEQIDADCRNAAIGCVDCKKRLADKVNVLLEPVRDKRASLESKPGRVEAMLADGSAKAGAVAGDTLRAVREALRLL